MSKTMMKPTSEMPRWQDWASFALGLWLAVSPWMADYAAHDAATANAAFVGLSLALLAHFGFSCEHVSCEWLNLGSGLWLLIAPFALGFDVNHVAAVNSVVVGAFVAVLSAWALQLDREMAKLWHRLIAGH
jgi:hypothetical protein